MIPKFETEIRREIVPSKLEWPDEETLTFEDGLMANHFYSDDRGASWKNYLETYKIEKRIVDDLAKRATDADHFEELAEEADDEVLMNGECPFWWYEVGISSITTAVSALGCAPVSSCRHHPARSNEEAPYVAFWADLMHGKVIERVSEQSQVGAINYDIEGYEGIMIYSAGVQDLMDFSKALADDQMKRRG